MHFVEIIGVTLAALLAVLGLIGGLLSLPAQVAKFRRDRRPLGDRGTQFFILKRDDSPDHDVAEFLVADDLMHFLSASGKAGGGATTLEVEAVGEFYRVRHQYPKGALENGFQKVPK